MHSDLNPPDSPPRYFEEAVPFRLQVSDMLSRDSFCSVAADRALQLALDLAELILETDESTTVEASPSSSEDEALFCQPREAHHLKDS